MLLWDIIRDWFVQNIWGGIASNGDAFYGRVGNIAYSIDGGNETITDSVMNTDFFFNLGHMQNTAEGVIIDNASISLADWLSTTSTIIVLVAICVGFFFLVRWLFRLTAGLIAGRG